MTALTTADLGPLADDPATLREAQAREKLRKAEQRELMRIAAVRALEHSGNGKRLDPEARAWAKKWAAIEPLGRALSTGEPS